MKLLYCPRCHDVRKLPPAPSSPKYAVCDCGKSWGHYSNDINAVYGGDAIMLGFSNSSLAQALVLQERLGDLSTGRGRPFDAFVIPKGAPTVSREPQGAKRAG